MSNYFIEDGSIRKYSGRGSIGIGQDPKKIIRELRKLEKESRMLQEESRMLQEELLKHISRCVQDIKGRS